MLLKVQKKIIFSVYIATIAYILVRSDRSYSGPRSFTSTIYRAVGSTAERKGLVLGTEDRGNEVIIGNCTRYTTEVLCSLL